MAMDWRSQWRGAGSGGWSSSSGGWAQVSFSEDGNSFAIEQEDVGLRDDNVEQWVATVEKALKGYKDGSCSSLNISRNALTSWGIEQILGLILRLRISVRLLKFFKNYVTDDGMQVVGELIKSSAKPVQEVHFSHNQVTWKGTWSILLAAKDSDHYPCKFKGSDAPLWLRLEANNIDFDIVSAKAEQNDISWHAAESRETWKSEKNDIGEPMKCPDVAIHWSYRRQLPTDGGFHGAFKGKGKGKGKSKDKGWSDGWGEYSRPSGEGGSLDNALGKLMPGVPPPPRPVTQSERENGNIAADAMSHLSGSGAASEHDLALKRDMEQLKTDRRQMDSSIQQMVSEVERKMDFVLSCLEEIRGQQRHLEATVQQLQQCQQRQEVYFQQLDPMQQQQMQGQHYGMYHQQGQQPHMSQRIMNQQQMPMMQQGQDRHQMQPHSQHVQPQHFPMQHSDPHMQQSIWKPTGSEQNMHKGMLSVQPPPRSMGNAAEDSGTPELWEGTGGPWQS